MAAFLLVGTVLASVGCGGGSTPPPVVVLPFTVNAINPANNTIDVNLSQEVQVFFSREVDPGTVNSFSLRVVSASGGEIIGTRVHNPLSPTLIRFLPSNSYFPNEQHRVIVTRAVLDKDGDRLDQDYEFQFDTQGVGPELPDSRNLENLGDFLRVGRWLHRATLLDDDTILVTGGYNADNTVTDRVGRIQARARRNFDANPLNFARASHVQIRLLDGRILVAGGESMDTPFVPLAACEVFTPGNGQFTVINPMNTARSDAVATLLADGRVLVTGGQGLDGNGNFIFHSTAELFDPSTGQWTQLAATMARPRSGHVAIRQPDGRVLIFGGSSSTISSEFFDPVALAFTGGAPLSNRPRFLSATTRLPDGRLFVAGGVGANTAQILDPTFGFLNTTNQLQDERARATATAFADGRVLIVGGTDFSSNPAFLRNTVDIFLPENGSGRVFRLPDLQMPRPTTHHAALRGPDGAIWIMGGLPTNLFFPGLRQTLLIHPQVPGTD